MAEALSSRDQLRWQVINGDAAATAQLVREFQIGFSEWAQLDAGSSPEEFILREPIALVDQNGQLRGFWRSDVAGRGNAINAARLFAARYGPQP